MDDLTFEELGLAEVTLDEYTNIPDGDYPVLIESYEIKPHADGHGRRLNLKVRVTDGQYKGRVLFDGLSVNHRNEMAQQIALKKLKTLASIVGGQSTADLVGKECVAKIGMSKGGNGYEPRNEIKAYKKGTVSAPAPSWLGGA